MISKARKQQREKQSMTVGDRLFKEVMSDPEDEDDPYLFDECMMEGGPGTSKRQKGKPRAYTLCMIANPAGYDQAHQQWKQAASQRAHNGKKIVVNSTGYNQAMIGQADNN